MRKLLRANLSRLRHDRTFRLLSALTVFFGVFMTVVNAVNVHREGAVWVMDFRLLTCAILCPILNSVLAALFVGSDYSGGTLRNKLIAGHRRGNIYLANLITCCCAGIILSIAFVVPQGALGLLLGEQIQSAPVKLLMYEALSLALLAALTGTLYADRHAVPKQIAHGCRMYSAGICAAFHRRLHHLCAERAGVSGGLFLYRGRRDRGGTGDEKSQLHQRNKAEGL